MSTVRWHPRGESERRRSKGSGYKLGVTGGWKSTQEMYELIRREMIDGRRETCTLCIMLQESEAHRGLQRQGRGRRTEEMCMERCWVESGLRGLSKRVCHGAMLVRVTSSRAERGQCTGWSRP